jgi:hypothetical protein
MPASIDQLSRSISLDSASLDFTKYAKSLLAAKGNPSEALQLAMARGASPRLKEMFEAPVAIAKIYDKLTLKAPVAIGSAGGSTWGDELAPYLEASTAFVTSLAPFSCFDRMLSDGAFTRMPLRTRISIASSAALGSSVSELAPKPISAMSFAQEYLTAYKAVATLVISDELAKSAAPGANDLFANELRKAVALATDTRFLEVISASTGIASSPSTGLSAAQFLADLATALEAIEVGVGSKLYLVLPMSVAKTIVLLHDSAPSTSFTLPQMTVTGGTIQGIRVIVTSAATNDGILLDGSAIAADSDLVTTEVVRNATLRMDDAENPTAGVYRLISLWQNNLQAMRAERYFGAAVLRSDGIAIISDMATT